MNAATIHREFMRNGVVAIHTALTAVPLALSINLTFSSVFTKLPDNFMWYRTHGTEVFWAHCALALGIVGLAGLFVRSRNAKLLSATLLGMGHAAMATGFYLGNPVSLSVETYTILAALALWRIYLEA